MSGKSKIVFRVVLVGVLLIGVYFRSSGLFRGLEDGVVFHPDSPKQVRMLQNYLSGTYVQYYGNLFYDGYPYGLNRVDEFLLRLRRRLWLPVRDVLYTPGDGPGEVTRVGLYYQGRVLRVLYGFTVMVLLYSSALLLLGPWYGIIAAALYGIAPLGATVTHSVTGDVGVDLFLALLLWALANFVRSGACRWFFVAGAACGMAFVCKFQGILGVWVLLLLAIGGGWPFAGGSPKRIWYSLGLGFAGLASGAVLLNPALWIDPTRTWRYMRMNFGFIKNYNVPSSFLELPVHERMQHALGVNLFPTMAHVGIMLFVLSAMSLVMVVVRVIHGLRDKDSVTPRSMRESLFVFGMTSFSFGSLLMATALKPVVQPFHFSFLLPTLVLGALHGIGYLWSVKSRMLRGLVCVALFLTAAELLTGSVQEDYFWRRPENAVFGRRFAEVVTGDRSMGGGRIPRDRISNYFYTESAVKPVFRNRPTGMQAPTLWWMHHTRLPYPTVPFGGKSHWIFMHGAEYPRSQGNFVVAADQSRAHTLVYREPPSDLKVGLRTGAAPSRYHVRLRGGIVKRGFLPPNSQTVLSFTSLKPDYHHIGQSDWDRAVGLHVDFRSELGPVWVSILRDSQSAALFEYYGPGPVVASEALRESAGLGGDISELEAALTPVLYYRSEATLPIGASYSQLPGSRDLVLPAGCYALRLKVLNTAGSGLLHVRLSHPEMLECELMSEFEVPAGYTEHVWRFSKSYIPFVFALEAAFPHAGLSIVGWELKPDPEAMAGYLPQNEPIEGVLIPQPLRIEFPGVGVLRGMAVCTTSKRVRYLVRFELDAAIRSNTYRDSIIFLHVKDEQGTQVAGWDIALASAALSDEDAAWQEAPSLAPGTYFVDGGLYHKRTTKRFRFKRPGDDTESNMKRRYVRLVTFTVD